MTSEYVEVMDRIDRKIQGAARFVPAPIVRTTPGAKLGLVTVGGCHAACVEALDLLAQRRHRPRLHARARLPVRRRGASFLESHDVNFIVEQNRDGQLRNLLMLETGVPAEKLESVRDYGGFPMSAHEVDFRSQGEAGEGGMT